MLWRVRFAEQSPRQYGTIPSRASGQRALRRASSRGSKRSSLRNWGTRAVHEPRPRGASRDALSLSTYRRLRACGFRHQADGVRNHRSTPQWPPLSQLAPRWPCSGRPRCRPLGGPAQFDADPRVSARAVSGMRAKRPFHRSRSRICATCRHLRPPMNDARGFGGSARNCRARDIRREIRRARSGRVRPLRVEGRRSGGSCALPRHALPRTIGLVLRQLLSAVPERSSLAPIIPSRARPHGVEGRTGYGSPLSCEVTLSLLVWRGSAQVSLATRTSSVSI